MKRQIPGSQPRETTESRCSFLLKIIHLNYQTGSWTPRPSPQQWVRVVKNLNIRWHQAVWCLRVITLHTKYFILPAFCGSFLRHWLWIKDQYCSPFLIEMQTTSTARRRNWQYSPGGVIKAFCCFCGYRLGHVCNCLKRSRSLRCTNVNIKESARLNKMLFKQYGARVISACPFFSRVEGFGRETGVSIKMRPAPS